MRRTLQLVTDPTAEEIAEEVIKLGLQKSPKRDWITDLFQCFSADKARLALSKPSTWDIEANTEADRIRIRERRKMEQLVLLEIVKRNQVDGSNLTKAVVNTFKLFDYLDTTSRKIGDCVPDENGKQKLRLEDLVEGIEKATDEIKKIRNEQDPLIAELLGIPEDEYPEQALAKLSKEQRKLLDLLSQVNEINAIKVGSFPTQIEDEESKKKKELLISSFEQVSKVPLGQRIGPLHAYKLATKQYGIQQGVKTIESKQILLVALDNSGSMRLESKQSWIKAILLNRIASVLDGRSELYIFRFVYSAYDFVKVTTREEARDYYKNYAFGSGGNTDIAGVLKKLALDLLQDKVDKFTVSSKLQPHVLIVNDGEDEIDPTFTMNGIVHAFVLGVENRNLKRVVEKSGGHYQSVKITDTNYI